MEQKTKATIIIPTVGRPCLLQTLQSLAQNPDFQQVEVIVVGEIHDAAVAGALQDLQAAKGHIRHLPLSFSAGDSSAKKNAGWRAAATEVVAFLDDDVIVPPGWITAMTAAFSDPAVSLASGPARPPENITRISDP
ncbi:MAG: glycosyltransferase family 2 protein [Lentisphaerae bacterium]|nr:glycosyltransferase family 2 protein [Lentisphaerota bacterium]